MGGNRAPSLLALVLLGMTMTLCSYCADFSVAAMCHRSGPPPHRVPAQVKCFLYTGSAQHTVLGARARRLRPTFQPALRGGQKEEPASQFWDVKTGVGNGWNNDTNFTVFRHRESGAAIEIVHDDDEMCMGFFRFLTAQIFDMQPDFPIFANFYKDCPGWSTFVNGNYTGDFLLSKDTYWELADKPGTFPIPAPHFPVGNWTATDMGEFIVLQHAYPGCAGAQIVLTCEGFTYLGCNDTFGYVRSPPQAIIVTGQNEPVVESLEVARRRFEHVLPPQVYVLLPEEDDDDGEIEPSSNEEDELLSYGDEQDHPHVGHHQAHDHENGKCGC